MKAYKRELSHFFSNKKEQDNKLKRALADKSFEEKKEIIAQYRETTKLEEGVYSIDEHHFDRKRFVRDTIHLEHLKDDIANTYLEFNKYKYDGLYELLEVDEARFDQYERQLAELKENRDKMIRKKSEKVDQIKSFNDEIDFNIRQLVDSFHAAEKENRKEIYMNIILLKKRRFDSILPHLSMLEIDKMSTLVTDYEPVKGNEKKIAAFNVTDEPELNISHEILEELPEIEERIPNAPNSKSSNNSRSRSSNEE
jgi:hypothetical protein